MGNDPSFLFPEVSKSLEGLGVEGGRIRAFFVRNDRICFLISIFPSIALYSFAQLAPFLIVLATDMVERTNDAWLY